MTGKGKRNVQVGDNSLSQALATRIASNEGWLDFEEYMRIALHEPGIGYYASGNIPVGDHRQEGDFITAPETGHLFAECLANYIRANLPDGGELLELGPGTGNLAKGILQALASAGDNPPRYNMLETSPGLRQSQQEVLREAGFFENCAWHSSLPENFTGIILGNEVLDALPCRALIKHKGDWHVRGVTTDGNGGLAWQTGPLAEREDAERLAALSLPEGYCAEINHQAEALVATLANTLACGSLLLIDYGFPRHEMYHPQRHGGSLMSHWRHRASMDVLARPGEQDITSHVDFSAVAEAGMAHGMDLVGYTNLAAFLLDLGISDIAGKHGDGSDVKETAKLGQQMQVLLMPSEMGELFKVLALGKEHPQDPTGFGMRNLADSLQAHARNERLG